MNILKAIMCTVGIFAGATGLALLPYFFAEIGGVILLAIVFITLVVVFSIAFKRSDM